MLGPYAAGSSPPTAKIRAFFAHKCRCGLIATSPKSEKFPASTSNPLTRSISSASGTACGTPAHSTTMSAPRPFVKSRTNCNRSAFDIFPALIVWSAPSRFAKFSRYSDKSTAIIVPAPNIRAFIKKHIPSGPTPITTTVSSNRNDSFGNADICFALSSPTDTAKISVNTATSEGKSSGTFTKKLPGTI